MVDLIKKLHIRSVNLRGSNITVNNEFDPEGAENIDGITQTYREAEGFQSTKFMKGEGEVFCYDFRYNAGVRLIMKTDEEAAAQDAGFEPLIEIAASFDARYVSEINLPEEFLVSFAEQNVGYHVWPYWREYVQSACSKIGLNPTIQINHYFVAEKN